jgi:hypothetical protein
VTVSFVDTGGIVDHRYLEVIVSLVDTGGIVDHRYLEVIVSLVDTGGIVDQMVNNSTSINKTNNHL